MLNKTYMHRAFIFAVISVVTTAPVFAAERTRIEEGKEIAFDRKKGNCLACHMIDDGTLPGNTAPPLLAMKARFPESERLSAQISNPLVANPNSLMPPFGLHNVLTEDEIKKVVEYLYTL